MDKWVGADTDEIDFIKWYNKGYDALGMQRVILGSIFFY
jgi:hypothetical protein